MEKRTFETAAIVEMHLVRWSSDGSYFAVAAFVLMHGGAPSPPRIRFAHEVQGGPANIIQNASLSMTKFILKKISFEVVHRQVVGV